MCLSFFAAKALYLFCQQSSSTTHCLYTPTHAEATADSRFTLEAQVPALTLPPQTSARQLHIAGNVVGPLSTMLLKLYALRQPMLSRSTTDCLEMLCSAKNSHLGSAALGELLQQVLQQEAAWDRKDTDLMLALTSLIESGFTR